MASPRTRRVLRELKFKDGNNVRHSIFLFNLDRNTTLGFKVTCSLNFSFYYKYIYIFPLNPLKMVKYIP